MPFNLVTEFNKMTARIMLMCSLGEDVTDMEIDYWKNGQVSKKSLSDAMRQCFQDLIDRTVWPRLATLKWMLPFYIFKAEREIKRNVMTIRRVIEGIVERKRAALHAGNAKSGDFLSLLLTDDAFKNDPKRIIDECLTFFFAGS